MTDWDRPITKPIPGPVPTEEKQMSVKEKEHVAGMHKGEFKKCACSA